MPKPDSSHYLTFVTNLLLSNFVDILILNLSVGIIFFENETNCSLDYFKTQVT